MSFSFLDGLRVIDLSQYVPGPYATLLLADLGADVVSVEPPGGEPMRRFGPADKDGISAWYKQVNASKTVVEIDLKSAEGKSALEELIRGADAMLESYRPGVMDRLGFSEARIRELNSRLVYCALSGWGQTGPYRLRAGHDLNYMALMGGLVTSGTAETPVIAYPQVADFASGVQAAMAMLGGLMGRDRPGGSGEGCFIDTSIAESVIPWQMWTLTGMLRPGFGVDRAAIYLNGGTAFYNIYPTKDGRFMTLGAVEEKFWQAFCETVGRSDWIARQWEEAPQTVLIEEVRAALAEKTVEGWESVFAEVDCCFERVHEMAEMADHPHVQARGMVKRSDGEDPFIEVGFPAWIDGRPPEVRPPTRYSTASDIIEEWT